MGMQKSPLLAESSGRGSGPSSRPTAPVGISGPYAPVVETYCPIITTPNVTNITLLNDLHFEPSAPVRLIAVDSNRLHIEAEINE
jgi:hypothetical protein